jgi:hypothetical protein
MSAAPFIWFAEPVACTDPATPVGRLILADDGLTFVPGRRSRAASRTDQPWLSHALSDDEGHEDAFAAVAARPPADQRAAIAGSLHFAAPDITLAGRTLTARAADTARTFTLPPVLGEALRAWQSGKTARPSPTSTV